jgi:phosphate starvation-inducible protein PhoH
MKRKIEREHLNLIEVEPLTANQKKVWDSSNNLMLYGTAGSGKTFLACYIAMDDIFKKEYSKLVIVRSVVPTRDMGFLPGGEKEKAEVYEAPYAGVFTELFDCGTAYLQLKQKGYVEFKTTSFIRGTTISDAVIIVDEIQNLSFHELDSIITRVGNNCKIIFCGDFNQADLAKNGMKKFLDILKSMPEFDLIEFGIQDIVRSGLVKNYLIAKEHYESGTIK